MDHVDFRPTTTALAALVRGVRDDQLTRPHALPRLLRRRPARPHRRARRSRSRGAARKEELSGGGAPSADGSRLEDGWRDRIAGALDDLGEAWQDPAAYDGMTMAGPIEMPADQAALVALDEVTVHAWDLAVATGQPYAADPAAVAACQAFVASFEPPPGGAADDGGLFGPPVAVPADAPALDRLIGATGRDPAWTP